MDFAFGPRIAFYAKWAAQGFAAARLDLLILAASVLVAGLVAVDNLWLESVRPATPPARCLARRRRRA